jgi:hypothetical protein
MGRDHLRRLEDRSVILSGTADTDRLQLHLSFPYSVDALATAPLRLFPR